LVFELPDQLLEVVVLDDRHIVVRIGLLLVKGSHISVSEISNVIFTVPAPVATSSSSLLVGDPHRQEIRCRCHNKLLLESVEDSRLNIILTQDIWANHGLWAIFIDSLAAVLRGFVSYARGLLAV